jgi:hypothetical protein
MNSHAGGRVGQSLYSVPESSESLSTFLQHTQLHIAGNGVENLKLRWGQELRSAKVLKPIPCT